MSSKVKKIIGVAVIIILALVAYRMFFVSGPQELLESRPVDSGAVGRELLNTLSTLESLSLEGEVLQSLEFRSLQDFGVSVTENPLGRRNPFAPIGIGNISGAPEFDEVTDEGDENDENTDTSDETVEEDGSDEDGGNDDTVTE